MMKVLVQSGKANQPTACRVEEGKSEGESKSLTGTCRFKQVWHKTGRGWAGTRGVSEMEGLAVSERRSVVVIRRRRGQHAIATDCNCPLISSASIATGKAGEGRGNRLRQVARRTANHSLQQATP